MNNFSNESISEAWSEEESSLASDAKSALSSVD
jgi:hypothetical protein